MNYPEKVIDNYELINILFIYNIKNIEIISTFLAGSSSVNWNNYVSHYGSNRDTRYLNNIKKILKKIKEIESKKELDIKQIISDNIEILSKYKNPENIKYINSLINRIKSADSLYSLFNILIERFKTRVVVKDKKEKSSNKRVTIKYVLDKEGHIYANMASVNGVLYFDKKSFQNEVLLFNEGIENGKLLGLEIPKKYGNKLSLLEKKRRIYLKTMFNLNSEMSNICNKELDYLFPIDKYFNYANQIVANLYKELFEYNKKDNKLWQETIANYGCARCLLLYESIYWRVINKFQYVDDRILMEYIDVTSLEKIRSENVLFKDISSIIPSPEDIYYALSNLIIKNTNNNFNYYLKDLDRLRKSIHYMTIQQIVDFYNCFKKLLREKDKNNHYYIEVQRIFAEEISVRTNIKDLKEVVSTYLREDIVF